MGWAYWTRGPKPTHTSWAQEQNNSICWANRLPKRRNYNGGNDLLAQPPSKKPILTFSFLAKKRGRIQILTMQEITQKGEEMRDSHVLRRVGG
jgi:hypothetical protein